MSLNERVISIGKPIYNNGKYEVTFELPPELRSFFRESCFWFECPDAGEVPESIAAIPAVASLMPLAWVFNYAVVVDVLDKTYFNALPLIKEGYSNMLPKLSLQGELKVGRIIACKKETASGSPLQLFSGGVDAWCTLVRHIDERPRLVTVWGADIDVGNDRAWSTVYSYSQSVAENLGLPCSYVKSNLRAMYDYHALNEHLAKMETSYEWWHDLQHGMAFLGLVSPLAYATDAPLAYIASTYSAEDVGTYVCASDPTIDDRFAAGIVRGKHDGFELLRQDKVDQIVEFSKNSFANINLRVCFNVASGRNCCRCEKCGRTILGIYAAGGDPHEFGFEFSSAKLCLLAFRMHWLYIMEPSYYKYMREDAERHPGSVPRCFGWFFKGSLEQVCNNSFKRAWKRFHNFGAGLYHRLIGC